MVLEVTGPYEQFAHLETLYLGVLARRTRVGTNTRRVVEAAKPLEAMENESKRLAARYVIQNGVAICDARIRDHAYDKTKLLLLGQELAPISLVHDQSTVTVAARFDSGIDLVEMLGLDGGMPTRVSVAAKKLDEVVAILAAREARGDAS